MRLKNLAFFIIGAVFAAVVVKRLWKQKFTEEEIKSNTEQQQKEMYYNWLTLKRNGTTIAESILEIGAKRVAVLGLDKMGRLLIDDLYGSDVSVEYAIELDNPTFVHETLEVYRLRDDLLPPVDMIIVCPPYKIDDVHGELKKEIDAKIVSLVDLIKKENK